MDAETHADSRNEETPEHQEDTDMVQVMVDRLAQERVPVRELNREQGMSLLDKNARFYLGISGISSRVWMKNLTRLMYMPLPLYMSM